MFLLDEKNTQSLTKPAKIILGAAVGVVNKEKTEKIVEEQNWRFWYMKHFMLMVEVRYY